MIALYAILALAVVGASYLAARFRGPRRWPREQHPSYFSSTEQRDWK